MPEIITMALFCAALIGCIATGISIIPALVAGLAIFLVHGRLTGHAWGAMIRKPSDLGFDDGRYNLPPLHVHQHTVESCMESANEAGFLFPMEAGDLSARRNARKESIDARVQAAAASTWARGRS